MACWVVPSVAAELWGVSLSQVQSWVRDGSIATRVDEGFTVVDVSSPGGKVERPDQRVPRPPTYRVVSPREVSALLADDPAVIPPPTTQAPPPPKESAPDEASADLGDWRAARRRAGFMRIGPARTLRAAS
jgi:hypothetical protein